MVFPFVQRSKRLFRIHHANHGFISKIHRLAIFLAFLGSGSFPLNYVLFTDDSYDRVFH